MPSLPSEFLAVILTYAGLFYRRVFVHVQLLAEAILAPGKRTLTSVLRIAGRRQHERAFGKYHRVMS